MRVINFNPANLTGDQQVWWNKWQTRATTATAQIIAEWEAWLEKWLKKRDPAIRFTGDFNSQIWADLKEWMTQNLFHSHCAYCETGMIGFWGDAEHHRPKGRVSITDPHGVSMAGSALVEVAGQQVQLSHPGYFWLAYDWRNLIPSCQWCNQGGGKVDQYPAGKVHLIMKELTAAHGPTLEKPIQSTKWPASYYLAPSDLDVHESPFLLNPLNVTSGREPLNHLRFGIRGAITSVDGSAIGAETIRVLRLDDPLRTQSREKAQKNIHRAYGLTYADPDHTQEDLDRILRAFRSGEEDYSVSALEYIRIKYP